MLLKEKKSKLRQQMNGMQNFPFLKQKDTNKLICFFVDVFKSFFFLCIAKISCKKLLILEEIFVGTL